LQTEAIYRGLVDIIPVRALELCTWKDLKQRVCGDMAIDADVLERNTTYECVSTRVFLLRRTCSPLYLAPCRTNLPRVPRNRRLPLFGIACSFRCSRQNRFTPEHPNIRNFWTVFRSFTNDQRQKFIKCVTMSSTLLVVAPPLCLYITYC
jgi:hypothetical protein